MQLLFISYRHDFKFPYFKKYFFFLPYNVTEREKISSIIKMKEQLNCTFSGIPYFLIGCSCSFNSDAWAQSILAEVPRGVFSVFYHLPGSMAMLLSAQVMLPLSMIKRNTENKNYVSPFKYFPALSRAPKELIQFIKCEQKF